MLTAGLSAKIYKNFSKAQNEFIKLKGEKQLLQLLKREGDFDDCLCMIIDHIIDLVVVFNI